MPSTPSAPAAGAHDSPSHDSHNFDAIAAHYDQMGWHNDFRDWLSEELITRQGWIGIDLNGGGGLKVLDYAAGTGVFSQALAPHSSQILGVDTSQQMVASYNAKFRDQGERIRAVVADFTSETASSDTTPDDKNSDFWNFDLAVIGLGFHHFNNDQSAAKKLVERLKPGGILLIIDMKKNGDIGSHSHGHHEQPVHRHVHGEHHTPSPAVVGIAKHGIHHAPGVQKHATMRAMPSGYSEQEILTIMGSAGLTDVGYVDVKMGFTMSEGLDGRGGSFGACEEPGQEKKGEIRRDIFMAKGRKQTHHSSSI